MNKPDMGAASNQRLDSSSTDIEEEKEKHCLKFNGYISFQVLTMVDLKP